MKTKLIITLFILTLGLIILYFIPAPKSDFFQHYKKKDEASALLKEFYKQPVKFIEVEGVQWKYISLGKGTHTILFLHGMGGAYDLWWQQIAEFKKDYRVISYTLPEEIHTLEGVRKGIEAILKKEKVDKFYAVGTSMGGYIAQYLVKTMPNRVEKAVFGNTFPPNDVLIKENAQKEKWVRILPEYIISLFGAKSLKEKLLPAGENDSLLAAFLPSLPFSKKQFIGRYEIVTDFFVINPAKYIYKRIPKLLMISDNDPLIPKQLRKDIVELYPEADVFVFHNKGHFPYINDAKKFNKVLRKFLEKPNKFEQIETALENNYFEGRKNADINRLKKIFDERSNLFVKIKDSVLNISLDDYLAHVQNSGKQNIRTQILDINIKNEMANAQVSFRYPEQTYFDFLNMLKVQGHWKIVNKTSIKK